MNSILTAKTLSEKQEYAGRKWFYNFRELPLIFDGNTSSKIATKLSTRYSILTKNWDAEKNSEWLCRNYLSAKMIMSATLTLNALEFSQKSNLRIVSPYLAYYSILSLLRGLIYTIPEVEWNAGELAKISHQKAISIAYDYVAKFDFDLAKKQIGQTQELKAFRELISYRSPASGDKNISKNCDVLNLATMLSELAQFNSELLEASVIKNANGSSFVFLKSYQDQLSQVTIEDIQFFDTEDSYRLDYLSRKYPLPPNILHVMTEGHVEDFFGAWSPPDNREGCFDPDDNWQLIFDIP